MSDEMWTLSMLVDHLSPYLAQLNVLRQLYTCGIEACRYVSSSSYKASHLLEQIFIILTNLSHLGEEQNQLV